MDDLHAEVRAAKDLAVQAMITGNPVDQAKSELAFWTLMRNNGPQILDIVDDALQAHKEGKI